MNGKIIKELIMGVLILMVGIPILVFMWGAIYIVARQVVITIVGTH